MYGVNARKNWYFVALLLLCAVTFVFAFHAVIPHQHPHDVLPLGSFGMLHGGLAEKFLLVIVPILMTVLSLKSLSSGTLHRLILRYGGQNAQIHSLLLYRVLFSRGIVHLNQR